MFWNKYLHPYPIQRRICGDAFNLQKRMCSSWIIKWILLFIMIFVNFVYFLKKSQDINWNFSSIQNRVCLKEKVFNLTVAALIKNDVPYLVEWIAFHRLQGVDHFVLYDDRSIDGLPLFVSLFEQIGENDLIEVIPASDHDISQMYEYGSMNYVRNIQQACYNHCLKYMEDRTKLILFIDTDEFVFPVTNDILVDELKKPQYDPFPFVEMKNVRFGSNDVMLRNRVFLYLNETSSRVELHFSVLKPDNRTAESYSAIDLYPLITASHVVRMPVRDLDNKTIKLDSRCYTPTHILLECDFGSGKTAVRPGTCTNYLHHFCLKATNGKPVDRQILYNNPSKTIRMNHYFLRSIEDIEKMPKWKGSKRASYNRYDKTVFSLVRDDYAANKYDRLLRDYITRFNPQLYFESES